MVPCPLVPWKSLEQPWQPRGRVDHVESAIRCGVKHIDGRLLLLGVIKNGSLGVFDVDVTKEIVSALLYDDCRGMGVESANSGTGELVIRKSFIDPRRTLVNLHRVYFSANDSFLVCASVMYET
jgi:hypothetical protein